MAQRICTVDGCDRKHHVHGMCNMHRLRVLANGTTEARTYGRDGCVVSGCDRKHGAQGYCQMHYMRLKRHGTTDLPPRTPLGCVIEWCDKKHFGHGYCDTHYAQWRQHGLTLPRRDPDDIQYDAAHHRVYRVKGAAKLHPCVDCGQPAAQWSFNHRDPDPRYSHRGFPYSPNVDFYDARCVPCHKRFDLNREEASA